MSYFAMKIKKIEEFLLYFPKLHVDENLIVYSDYKWLSFVIYQLLTNAIKYSDNGKSVFIKAYNEDKKIY